MHVPRTERSSMGDHQAPDGCMTSSLAAHVPFTDSRMLYWSLYIILSQLLVHQAVSILSGEVLRLRERNRSDNGEPFLEPFALSGEILLLLDLNGDLEPERLREMYREPIGEGDLPPRLALRSRLGLRDGADPERPLPLFLLLSELLLLLLSLSLPCSLLPSIASSKRLFRGPISPSSSKTSLFVRRGRMRSHTRSSVSN